jgi:hypothetical protein
LEDECDEILWKCLAGEMAGVWSGGPGYLNHQVRDALFEWFIDPY